MEIARVMGTVGSTRKDENLSGIKLLMVQPLTPNREPVDEFMNVPLLLERATAAYLFARRHGCEENRLRMMRELISDASGKMTALAAASAPPPQAAAGAAPSLAPQGAGPAPTPAPALPPPVAP